MEKHFGNGCFVYSAFLYIKKNKHEVFPPPLDFPCSCLTWRNTTLNSIQLITFSIRAVRMKGKEDSWVSVDFL